MYPRLWAAHTGKIDARTPLTQRVFDIVLAGQARCTVPMLRAIGIVDAASFETKRKALAAAAATTPESLTPWGLRPGTGGPWRLDPRFVSWPMVFTHACEHRQMLNKLGYGTCAGLCSAATHVIADCAAQIARSAGAKSDLKCHTVALAEAVYGALKTQPPPQPPRRLRMCGKRPGCKAQVVCPRCHSVVRRDVIARHWQSQKCVLAPAGGLAAARPQGSNTAQCCHCGGAYIASQRKRHLRSARCMAARAGGSAPSGTASGAAPAARPGPG